MKKADQEWVKEDIWASVVYLLRDWVSPRGSSGLGKCKSRRCSEATKKAVAERPFHNDLLWKKMTIQLDLTWREKLSMSRHALHWKGCADTRRDKEADLQGQRVTNGCQENTGVWQGAKKFKVRALCDRGVRGIWAHSGGLKSHRMQKKGVWGRKTERERGDTSLLDFREPTLANHKSWLVGNILIYPRTHTHVFDVNSETPVNQQFFIWMRSADDLKGRQNL